MSLRFFSDQCVPAEITETLRRHGHNVTLVRETIPIRSPDDVVISKAQEFASILLSLNADFADIVTYPPANYRGIVAVQLHNHPEIIPQLMDRLIAFLNANPAQEFYHGKLFIVEVHRPLSTNSWERHLMVKLRNDLFHEVLWHEGRPSSKIGNLPYSMPMRMGVLNELIIRALIEKSAKSRS